jgi:hypothetical protein
VGLVSRMGGCASSKLLSSEDQAALKIWIEDSYNYADEVNEKIRSHKLSVRFYVLDTFTKDYVPSVDNLRSLARVPVPTALANSFTMMVLLVSFSTTCRGVFMIPPLFDALLSCTS